MNIEMAERKHMGGVSLMWCEKKVQKTESYFCSLQRLTALDHQL